MPDKKKVVAIAGGTSPTLGTAIANALVNSTSCEPVILSRYKADAAQPSTSELHVPIRYVDYSDHASLVEALRGVHTVISVIKIPRPEWATVQINLVNAACEAGVKRFAPSEFEQGAASDGKVDVFALKLQVWDACKASKMEVSRFECGGFMNALVVTAAKNPRFDAEALQRIEDALHGLSVQDELCDLERETAQELVKDDGISPRITLTEISDIGRFVAAACELPDGSWKENMSMVGETLLVSEVLGTLEEVSGITLRRSRVTKADLQKRVDRVEGVGNNLEEIFDKLWAQLQIVMIEDTRGAGLLDPVVNEMCPQVRPQSLREYLKRCFGGN